MGSRLGLALAIVVGVAVGAWGEPPASWVDAARGFPVAAEGRIVPLDTWAQVVYARLSGKERAPEALGWFLTLLTTPEVLTDEPFLVVNDPAALGGTGLAVPGRGRYSPRQLAAALPQADAWSRVTDPSSLGRERQRLGRALVLYQDLAATFDPTNPRADQSPLKCLNLALGPLNPAQALGTPMPTAERDRLALVLLWHQASVARQWDEAVQALTLFNGHAADLELVHNRVPWAPLVAVLGLAALGWGLVSRKARWWSLAAAGWVVVTAWLVVRMVLSGRPPVTNLPSTFLFVSWVLLGLGAVLARLPDQRLTAQLAVAAGALAPLVTLGLEGGSDPFSPLQAVLNTNLWLGLHVTTIVAGYAATLAVGLLGHAYLFVATQKYPGEKRSGGLLPLWNNLRIALVVALVLTATGTVLGGVWADQSWGRFWGWDPKENGALLVVVWLALVLHLKPSGLVAEWGSAVGAALALPVLWFSWMGVNLLGLGFHSYGAAPGRVLLFLVPLALESLVLAFVTLRKVLR